MMCFSFFSGYLIAQAIIVKMMKHKPANWSDCVFIVGMTVFIQSVINLAFGETVMTLETVGTIVVGCFFGQLIISAFTEGKQ